MIGTIVVRLVYDIARKILEGVHSYTWNILETKQVIYLHKKFVDKVSQIELAMFETPYTVGLIQRAYNRLQLQMKYYTKWVIGLVGLLIELSVSMAIFYFASPLFASIIILSNLVPIFINGKFSRGLFNIYKGDEETKRKFGYTSNLITERTTLPEIKLNQAFGFIKKRLVEIYKKHTEKQLRHEKKFQIFTTLGQLLPIFSIFLFSIFIAKRLSDGAITTGTFVFLFTNVFTFSRALSDIGNTVNSLIEDSFFINELIEFNNIKPKIVFPTTTPIIKNQIFEKIKNPKITIENLSFKYPTSNSLVLNRINLEISYGQNLALIGENGAGKSTLVKLLLRMYDPTEGRILLNDIDIKQIPEDILYKTYSTLFQSFGKFYLTIKENLQLAAGKELSSEEMIDCLKFSNAWEYVKNLKYKYNQQLGPEYKEGIDLSGGQWQLLAIARAYAKKAPILILDEPTSAVDAKSEMQIFDRLNKEMKQNTLIFISHRFSTIKDAERIVVLDKGKAVEDGTHQELMALNGKYQKLYTIQAERYLRA